jgi:hypothetical protein
MSYKVFDNLLPDTTIENLKVWRVVRGRELKVCLLESIESIEIERRERPLDKSAFTIKEHDGYLAFSFDLLTKKKDVIIIRFVFSRTVSEELRVQVVSPHVAVQLLR